MNKQVGVAVVTAVASQQGGSGFSPRIGRGTFLSLRYWVVHRKSIFTYSIHVYKSE